MARYTGPISKKARSFGEAIYGNDKAFDKKKYPPGQHGQSRKRKQKSDYGTQLMEKQKAKYTYGVLERQFRKTFHEATKRHGVTGTVLLQLLESRLDNVVFRLGISPTRRGARQLVSHKHVTINGVVNNVPSTLVRPGDVVAVRGKSRNNGNLEGVGINPDIKKSPWLDWNADKLEGKFLAYPEREQIPEKINEQLIVELYSK
ncbi:MAG: 30S ribosomal protein S4 [Saprospiraceae bacterium]|nr:30S ribosomal protein S4 [Saprospiraceae bacterium]